MKNFLKQYVLVSTRSAGVHYGILEEIQVGLMCIVLLNRSRNIWSWAGAHTFNEIVNNGIDEKKSNVSEPIDGHLLTEVIEVVPLTEKAIKSLTKCKWVNK